MKKLNVSEVQEKLGMTVEDVIEDLFTQVNGEFGCISGDLTPEQDAELHDLKSQLQDILEAYVFQNQKQEKGGN